MFKILDKIDMDIIDIKVLKHNVRNFMYTELNE